ncbi:MAG: hypothetical protein ACYTFO_06175, partial [Planctomycetota bacterium]
MIGRSHISGNRDEVIAWSTKTRELAAEGFEDSTGLAAASLGWQAFAELGRGNRLAAIGLYVEQLAAGDDSAAASLRICARELLAAGDEQLDLAAGDELARAVVTAHLAGVGRRMSRAEPPGGDEVALWLAALERAGIDDLLGAGRLGWAAYRTGLMTEA